MSGSVECCVSPRSLRTFIMCVCFGAVFLWILHGSYMDAQDELPEHRRPLAHYRRLLAVSTAVNDTTPVLASTGNNTSDRKCSDVHSLSSNESKCHFIQTVDSCKSDGGLINYLQFVYCTIPSRLIPLAMVILFLWLVFLFIFLGATAEEYFCPALKVMSQVLHLSQNVAGVTLLALGNGAPDIFSAFAAINQEDDRKASLAVGALFGAGMFVTTIVVGAVTISKSFTLTQRPFLRDLIFYMAAVYWTFYLLWNGSVDIGNAAGFVTMYIFYVAVVIVGRVFFQKWKKMRRRGHNIPGDIPRPPSPPVGKELSESETSEKQMPSPLPISMSTSAEEGKGRVGSHEGVERPRRYQIESVSSCELSCSGHVSRPIIVVPNMEEDEKEGEEKDGEEKEGEAVKPTSSRAQQVPSDLGRVVAPGLTATAALLVPDRRGASPQRTFYGSTMEDTDINRSGSPAGDSPRLPHKPMRKTISGALDITEEVGAAIGIPHVAKIWEEVHRSHQSNRRVTRPSRSPTQTPIIEEPEEEEEPPEPPDDERAPLLRVKKTKKPHPFVKMLLGIIPFGPSFRDLGLLGKIYEIIKTPASILLALTVPVIDKDEEDHNWNKWLNVLHCVTAPVFIVLITTVGLINIGGVFPVWTLVLIIGALVGIVVACTSKNDKPPIYHCVFAWVGFAVAVVWIYSIANEIVNLLQTFGIVIRLSDGILGLTLLAWGNSIGDAVSNVTMARQGFPRMAIGACFGGPLLNMLLGIGIASLIKSIRKPEHYFKLYFTQVEFLAAIFLMASLACSLVAVTCLWFRLKRPYGVFLLVFYVVFLVLSCLAEANVFTVSISGVITDS